MTSTAWTAVSIVGSSVLQLLGILLVVLDVRDSRAAARGAAAEADAIRKHLSFYRGVGPGAWLDADYALRLLERLHREDAAAMQIGSVRAAWGAGLVVVGILIGASAGLVALI